MVVSGWSWAQYTSKLESPIADLEDIKTSDHGLRDSPNHQTITLRPAAVRPEGAGGFEEVYRRRLRRGTAVPLNI